MTERDKKAFILDRNTAYRRAVMDDDWAGVILFRKRWRLPPFNSIEYLQLTVFRAAAAADSGLPTPVRLTALGRLFNMTTDAINGVINEIDKLPKLSEDNNESLPEGTL